MATVFLSYSRKDSTFAKRLLAELQRGGLDTWIDWEDIPAGVDWWKEIEKSIEEADIFLFLISPDSITSKACGQEFETAIKNGKRIIPIVGRDIVPSEAPKQLTQLNWVFIRESDDFGTAVDHLITAMHTDYQWVQTHRRLQVSALKWNFNERDPGHLLRDDSYKEAFEVVAEGIKLGKQPKPTQIQIEYLQASHKANQGILGWLGFGPRPIEYEPEPSAFQRKSQTSEIDFPPGKYFISHSYGDAPVREKLIGQLPPGMEPVIFPPITVDPQDFVSNHLIEAILACDGLIYLRGGSSAKSFWVAFERDFAIRNGLPVFAADPDTLVIERDLSKPLDLAVYANYSRKDAKRVREVINFMKEERHFDVWVDYERLEPAVDWQEEIKLAIEEQIYRGGYQIIFWSTDAAKSMIVQEEINIAFKVWSNSKKEKDGYYNGAVFALLEKMDGEATNILPQEISRLNWHIVQIFGDEKRPAAHRLDDLIVRLYWLIYQNTNGLGLKTTTEKK